MLHPDISRYDYTAVTINLTGGIAEAEMAFQEYVRLHRC